MVLMWKSLLHWQVREISAGCKKNTKAESPW